MFAIVSEAINVRAVAAALEAKSAGGIVTFVGIVRGHADDGRAVLGLRYEAFEPLALAEFEAIGREARDEYGVLAIAIVHRIGSLCVGEVAVAVAVAAEHRGAAFDACEYAIDELKRRAQIWKKELYADGDAQWKRNE